MDTDTNKQGGFRLIFGARELIGLMTIMLALGPTLMWVGRLTVRVEALEAYRDNHEATTLPLKEMIQRDHAIVIQLQESQKTMASNVGEITKAVADNAVAIAVLRESQRR